MNDKISATSTAPRIMQYVRNLLARLLLLTIGILLPLLALEIGVRLVGLAPSELPNPSIWTPHPLLGWWHIPHSGGIFHSDYNEFEAEVRINARSLRDREIGYDNPNQAVRILSLADSFGEALQVDLEATYHKQLESLVADSQQRPVEVLNAGVGGWGTDQEAIFYLAEGFRYQPEVVLLAFFVRNDAVNNYGPLEIERNGGAQQKQFFTLSAEGVLIPPNLEGEAAVPVSQAEQLSDPQAVSAQVAGSGDNSAETATLLPLADTLWRYSALYRFLLPYLRDIPLVVQNLGSSGILGGEGVVRASHPSTPIPFFVYQEPPNEEFEAAWSLTEAIIARLRDEVEQRGSRLVVVIIAAPEQVSPQAWEGTLAANPAMQKLSWDLEAPNRRLSNFLSAENIPHLDLLPIFRQFSSQADASPLHLRHDQHWTAAGHRLAAESIYKFLVNEGIVNNEQ